ncbi:hypothetical protein ABK040_000043 [Willaertia magna]
MNSKTVTVIDGSLLEGGGQIIRNCCSLSYILNKPIQILNIRAKRNSPGLKSQHLTGIKLIATIPKNLNDGSSTTTSTFHTSGLSNNCSLGSTSFTYFPIFPDQLHLQKQYQLVNNNNQLNNNQLLKKEYGNKKNVSSSSSSSTKERIIFKEEKELESFTTLFEADCTTAGATTLLLQISLPCLLFYHPTTSIYNNNNNNNNNKEKLQFNNVLIKTILQGGTNVDFSPPIDEVTEILIPLLNKKFLLDDKCEIIKVNCLERGFYPKGNGKIELIIDQLKLLKNNNNSLNAIDLSERGNSIVMFKLFLNYTDDYQKSFIEKLSGTIVNELKKREFSKNYCNNNNIQISLQKVENNPSHSKIIFGTAIIVDNKENQFGASFHTKDFSTNKKHQKDIRVDEHVRITNDLLMRLEKQWNEKGCVDEHVQDQLIIFMALAKGKSKLRTGPLTLHTQTAIHFCEELTGVKFDINEQDDGSFLLEVDGIGQPFLQ